jgi:N-acetylneuraminic acid mutarotase
MKKHFGFVLLITFAGLLFAVPAPLPTFEPLPVPLSNNAVAMVKSRGALQLYSLMGIGPKKVWDATSNAAYALDPETGKWTEMHTIPGTAGRLAAAAIGAREHVFLFGGYVIDGQGGEATLPDVNVYEPLTDHWLRGEDIPVPVDDSVIGVHRDRYIYLIGGWSKSDAVRDVQVYDGEKNKWLKATPIPGTPVFGHAGALVGDTIVYIDGAYKNPAGDRPKYIASDECWLGKIDHKDLTKIQWTKLPNHPGNARYRIAAGGSEKDQKIYFSGGTDNPYNYNGIGYDGKPAEPSPVTFAYDLRAGKWETLNVNTPDPTMDHHGLLVLPEGLVIVGGMEKGQQVTSKVVVLAKQAAAAAAPKPLAGK